ncbi:MAG: lipoate--protein ligase family protein [Bacteroidales bacterium]|nr:lipoate--protein ligase family protein [Bacteroidales bacterium]MBQ1718061.1 lipoate--protein ligase family protein [Bacteroidales bacterium]MBQ2228995.1 lipoate--protein ligase family protein [Bacteroidales bacterium]
MDYISLPDEQTRPLSFYLAMEEYVAEVYGSGFFVWQVDPTVIIGRNQDLETEVNLPFCREHAVRVVRRKSGGGCVYADKGNLMVSFITPERGVDSVFPAFMRRLSAVLQSLGANAFVSGHNDVLVGGRKVSGSAFFVHPSSSIVHCTLMHSVDLDMLQSAITPPAAKLARHSVQSVRQRVANLTEFLPKLETGALKDALRAAFCSGERPLSAAELEAIEELEKSYDDPSFILGKAA